MASILEIMLKRILSGIGSFLDKKKEYGTSIVRYGVSLVFLWFGANQILDPSSFLGYLPSWAVNTVQMMHMQIITPGAFSLLLISLNGIFEVILGTALILGIFTRLAAFFLAAHLAMISFTVGYNEIGVRDFGLAMATFSLVLSKPDPLTLDKKLKR